jgi:hypothetical protein
MGMSVLRHGLVFFRVTSCPPTLESQETIQALLSTIRNLGFEPDPIGHFRRLAERLLRGRSKAQPGLEPFMSQPWMTTLPFAPRAHLLITAVGPARNTGMEYESTGQRSRLASPLWHLKAEGTSPALLEAVTGEIQIQCERAKEFKAWTLDAAGRRIREVPIQARDKAVQLQLNAEYETVYYELSVP